MRPSSVAASSQAASSSESEAESSNGQAGSASLAEPGGPAARLKRILCGPPRDLSDCSVAHKLSLVPILAWIGLGSDGLSSSAYGPEEAFRTLGEHGYLAVALAGMVILTIAVISAAYSRIIEEFPSGGGGYVVATKLLGEKVGLVSGSALLVDYVLTITVSIAASGDALFSLAPLAWHAYKLPVEVAMVVGLAVLNIRGVKESVVAMAPIFFLFLGTHATLILGGLYARAGAVAETASAATASFGHDASTMGLWAMFLLFIHAYSLGGGTYTGLEAVSNGLPIMREPRVRTAKRTMLYMAASLAVTAAGLLVLYLLFRVAPEPGKTLNATLLEAFAGSSPFGKGFVFLSLLAEGALLMVAAQTGYLDGPRVLANLAVDNWVPRRFASLSDRLTTQNGILLIGGASLIALLYTHGDVGHLVVMYSINVFLTFSLSMFGMARMQRAKRPDGTPHGGAGRLALFVSGFLLCAVILAITTVEKFAEGGWITLVVTSALVALCMAVRLHYREVARQTARLYADLETTSSGPEPASPPPPLDPARPTAAMLVAGYGGLGIHTLLNILKTFPGYYSNVVFLSVGVVDSGAFKGEDAIPALRARTEETLRKYVELAGRLGLAATYRMALGTDVTAEADALCRVIAEEFPHTTFFAGKIVFQRERWYQRLLHNETAFAVQRRLQWAGLPMVILPAKLA